MELSAIAMTTASHVSNPRPHQYAGSPLLLHISSIQYPSEKALWTEQTKKSCTKVRPLLNKLGLSPHYGASCI